MLIWSVKPKLDRTVKYHLAHGLRRASVRTWHLALLLDMLDRSRLDAAVHGMLRRDLATKIARDASRLEHIRRTALSAIARSADTADLLDALRQIAAIADLDTDKH